MYNKIKKHKLIKNTAISLMIMIGVLLIVAKIEELSDLIIGIKKEIPIAYYMYGEDAHECNANEIKSVFWQDSNYLIAHGGGGIQNIKNTNCLEAIENSYQNGLKYIEVDANITDDGKLCFSHNYEGFNQLPTYAEYNGYILYGKYHTLNMNTINILMERYKDLHLVIHLKFVITDHLQAFESLINEMNEEQLNNNICFLTEDKDVAEYLSTNHFMNISFFFYLNDNFTDVMEFCIKNRIRYITLPWYDEKIINSFISHGFQLLLYHSDDVEKIDKFIKNGGFAVYTNYVIPRDNGYHISYEK